MVTDFEFLKLEYISKCYIYLWPLQTISEDLWALWPADRLLTVSGPFLDEMEQCMYSSLSELLIKPNITSSIPN